HQHPLESLDQRLDAGRVEHVGVVFDAQPQLVPRLGLHRQRVVVVFTGGDIGDFQAVGTEHGGGVDRVVLVHEQGVEQLVVAGDPVDLAKRQVLVLQRVVVGALQLVEQVSGG